MDFRPRMLSGPLQAIVMRRTRGSTDRLSSLCFVLHRMGFFLPRELLHER